MSNKKLNCKGLSCPMPIVEIGKVMRTMEDGQILEVEADDPAFKADVEAFAEKMGYQIINITQTDITKVLIKKM